MSFRSHPLPRAIVHLRRWHLVAMVWPLADLVRICHVTGTLHWVSLPPWASGSLVSMLPVIPMVGTSIVIWVLERRLRRRAKLADSRICTDCLYPLAGDAGVCPECGRPFSIGELVKLWG